MPAYEEDFQLGAVALILCAVAGIVYFIWYEVENLDGGISDWLCSNFALGCVSEPSAPINPGNTTTNYTGSGGSNAPAGQSGGIGSIYEQFCNSFGWFCNKG
jgi:hypothetical protein